MWSGPEAPKATYRPPMIIPAPAPVAVEHPLLPVRELAHSPELVLRAECGDADGVRSTKMRTNPLGLPFGRGAASAWKVAGPRDRAREC